MSLLSEHHPPGSISAQMSIPGCQPYDPSPRSFSHPRLCTADRVSTPSRKSPRPTGRRQSRIPVKSGSSPQSITNTSSRSELSARTDSVLSQSVKIAATSSTIETDEAVTPSDHISVLPSDKCCAASIPRLGNHQATSALLSCPKERPVSIGFPSTIPRKVQIPIVPLNTHRDSEIPAPAPAPLDGGPSTTSNAMRDSAGLSQHPVTQKTTEAPWKRNRTPTSPCSYTIPAPARRPNNIRSRFQQTALPFETSLSSSSSVCLPTDASGTTKIFPPRKDSMSVVKSTADVDTSATSRDAHRFTQPTFTVKAPRHARSRHHLALSDLAGMFKRSKRPPIPPATPMTPTTRGNSEVLRDALSRRHRVGQGLSSSHMPNDAKPSSDDRSAEMQTLAVQVKQRAVMRSDIPNLKRLLEMATILNDLVPVHAQAKINMLNARQAAEQADKAFKHTARALEEVRRLARIMIE